MRKYLGVLLGISCFLLLFIGCNNIQEKIVIQAGLKRYSPTMSSAPGIPLTIKGENGRIFKNVTYHWTTQYGQFLKWDKEIKLLGADIKTTNRGEIYWSVGFQTKKSMTRFDINVKIEAKKTGNILAESKLTIEKDRNDYIIVKK